MVEHQHHGIDYVEITVSDLVTAKRFYREAFGWQFADYGDEYAGIRGPEREVGGLCVGAPAQAPPGAPLVVLFSSDLESTLAAVVEAGGRVTKEAFAFPGGRRFHFADPSGNELAVWSES